MSLLLHGTAVAIGGCGILLRGASGQGKSDLALRLIGQGAQLIADDQVIVSTGHALSPPATLAGLIEIRGVGIRRLPYISGVRLALVVDLVPPAAVERLPEPECVILAGRPVQRLVLAAFEASAPLKIRLALAADAAPAGAGPADEYKTAAMSNIAPAVTLVREPEPNGLAAQVVLVTGMSGAGRSTALKMLEDLGYEAVDNLPLKLLPRLVGPPCPERRPIAVGIDIRTRDFAVPNVLAELENLIATGGLACRLLFLDCDDDALARRFTETRRRHPLAGDRPVMDGIRLERVLVGLLRLRADIVVDTSALRTAELKRVLAGHFALGDRAALQVFVTSFSFRQGLPREADLVFDVRFLDNPYYDTALRPLTGLDPAVGAHIEGDPSFAGFFLSLTALLHPLLPRYDREGKSYLTIAIGCTGGRHRSVFVAERLGRWLTAEGQTVSVAHRDIDRPVNFAAERPPTPGGLSEPVPGAVPSKDIA